MAELHDNNVVIVVCSDGDLTDTDIEAVTYYKGEELTKMGIQDLGENSRTTAACGRGAAVSDEYIVDISEDVGTCWKELGVKLNISASKIHNLDDECKRNREKASQLLSSWKQTNGRKATIGILETALNEIGRTDIAEKLLGLAGIKVGEPGKMMSYSVVQKPDEVLKLINIPCNLKVESPNPILLYTNGKEKFLVKKIDIGEKETQGDVMEILEMEKLLENMVEAIADSKKWSNEQRRQKSLRKASKEIERLRKELKMSHLDSSENLDKRPEEYYQNDSEQIIQRETDTDPEVLLMNCETQRQNFTGMFDGLIILIAEVGPLDGNSRCLNQLCDFLRDFQGQQQQFYPQIDNLRVHHLSSSQAERYEVLKKWKRAQQRQVEGIEKLLTSQILKNKNFRISQNHRHF